MSTEPIRVAFDGQTLRDVLIVEDTYAKTTWPGDKYHAGLARSIWIDISEDEDVDAIIEALTAERSRRTKSRLQHAVDRLERQYEEALATKDKRWGDWERADTGAMAKYSGFSEARARLAEFEND